MANFFEDNTDLQYYVERGVDWETLARTAERGFTDPEGFDDTHQALEAYREILSLVGHFVADEIAPRVSELDRQPMRLVDGEVQEPPAMREIFAQLKELQLYGMTLPRELGGMNCPLLLQHVISELVARADVSVMTHFGFHAATATVMLLYSTLEGTTQFDAQGRVVSTRFSDAIREILAGEAWGSMDITEPNAGSDMAALRTRAELDADGVWRLTGEKVFITSGHGKYHFVIARTEQPASDGALSGLQGLSLFLVKAYDDHPDGRRTRYATIERVEEKLGHHASPTCSITFDNTPAELVGRRGEGFKLMLMLMNGARLGVGFESLGVCEAAHRLAANYAAERKSMGKSIDKHEVIAEYLDWMQTDIQGLRALLMEAAYSDELAQRGRMTLQWLPADSTEAQQVRTLVKRHGERSRSLTPLVKYFGAETAVSMARTAIQILGGAGYTTDYGAEKLLRDALVLPIYEGTSQIQALMAMKDVLSGILRAPQKFVRELAQARWRSVSARDPLERRLARLQSISYGVQQHLLSKTATDKLRHEPFSEWPQLLRKAWDPKRDFAYAALHAERLTRILTDVAIAEVLYRQQREHAERRELLERFLERAEPRCRFYQEEIFHSGERLLSQLEDDSASGEIDASKTA